MIDKNINLEEKESAPFNSAVATLMRLDNILTNIKDLNLNLKLSMGIKQYIKFKLVRDFYIQSFALLKSEDNKTKINGDISNLKPIFVNTYSNGKPTTIPIYSNEFELKLDKVLILIQEALQEEGYFMPEKVDRGL